MKRAIIAITSTAALAVLFLFISSPATTAQGLSPQGGTIVGATTGGGLEKNASKLGLKTTCSPTQVLAWDGDSWECATPAGGVTDGTYDDITVSGGGLSWIIGAGKVTLSKLADLATARIICRVTAGTGTPESCTGAQVVSLLPAATTTANGVVPNPGTATGRVLSDALTWVNTVAAVTTADILTGGCSSGTCALSTSIATARILGRTSAGTGSTEQLTATQATAMLDAFTATLKGLVPSPGSSTGRCLKDNATWGACDIVGVAGTTSTVAMFSSATAVGDSPLVYDGSSLLYTTKDLGEAKTAGTAWSLTTRGTPTTYPAATLQASQANTVLAFDLMPKGTPAIGSGGYTWMDVCDADLIASPSAAVRCARVGTDGYASFGSMGLQGGTAENLRLHIDGTTKLEIAPAQATLSVPLQVLPTSGNGILVGTLNQNTGTWSSITNTNSGTNAYTKYELSNDGSTGVADLFAFGTGYTTNGGLMQDATVLYSGAGMSSGLNLIAGGAAASMRFYTGGFATGNLNASTDSSGNWTFSKNVLLNGDVTLGDASGDSVTTAGLLTVNANIKFASGGLLKAKSDSPSVTSCGTGPTAIGGPIHGHVTTGTGATACTIPLTFANASPSCTVTARGSGAKNFDYSVGSTGIAITSAGAGSTYDWYCGDYY